VTSVENYAPARIYLVAIGRMSFGAEAKNLGEILFVQG